MITKVLMKLSTTDIAALKEKRKQIEDNESKLDSTNQVIEQQEYRLIQNKNVKLLLEVPCGDEFSLQVH